MSVVESIKSVAELAKRVSELELRNELGTKLAEAVTDLLTALSEHHPDPAVARAARKAAFKARSPSPGVRGRRS